MKTLAWVVIGGITCLTTWLYADHCPDDKMADGEPEQALAGISFEHDRIENVLARFGTPAKHDEGRDNDYPVGSGWASYEWKRGRATITVSTEFYTADSGARVEGMEVVELSGEPSGQAQGTGRGLRLGDSFDRTTKLYGTRYVEGTVNGPLLGKRMITYCFSDETELSLGFNGAGVLVAIRLAPSIE